MWEFGHTAVRGVGRALAEMRGSGRVWCETYFVVGHTLTVLKDVRNSGPGHVDAEIQVVLIRDREV